MIDIRIGKYHLVSSATDFTVSEIKTKKEGESAGEEYDTNQAYYPNLASALENVLKRKVLDSDATTLKELLKAHNTARGELQALWGGLV